MREVKEICAAMLEPPAPPMTTPERMLQLAGRAHRHRRARVATGFAAVAICFAVVSATIATVPGSPARAPFGDRAAVQARTSDNALWQWLPSTTAALQAAVPSGYTTTPVTGYLAFTGAAQAWPAVAIEVTRADRTGTIAFVRLSQRLAADPCREDATQEIYPSYVRRFRDAKPHCEVIRPLGLDVTIGTRVIDGTELRFAMRLDRDSRLIIFASPYPAEGARMPLEGPVLSLAQLAALMSHPVFAQVPGP